MRQLHVTLKIPIKTKSDWNTSSEEEQLAVLDFGRPVSRGTRFVQTAILKGDLNFMLILKDLCNTSGANLEVLHRHFGGIKFKNISFNSYVSLTNFFLIIYL